MGKNLNKTVADFKYKGRKYEVDLLLDSMCNGYTTYDIFDVTEDIDGKVYGVGHFELCQQNEDDYMPSELIEMAKDEIDKE